MPKLGKLLIELLQRRPSREGRLEKDAVVVLDDSQTEDQKNEGIQVERIVEVHPPAHRSVSREELVEIEEVQGQRPLEADFRIPVVQQQQQQQILLQFSNIKKLHFGSVYNFQGQRQTENDTGAEGEGVDPRPKYRKTKSIVAMMEDPSEPNHRFLDTVATHLGCDWKSLMRELGFSEGQMAQAFIDHHMHGQMKEVIYQLLLDWTRNAEDEERTIGYLVNVLWKNGQRECVHRLKHYWKSRDL